MKYFFAVTSGRKCSNRGVSVQSAGNVGVQTSTLRGISHLQWRMERSCRDSYENRTMRIFGMTDASSIRKAVDGRSCRLNPDWLSEQKAKPAAISVFFARYSSSRHMPSRPSRSRSQSDTKVLCSGGKGLTLARSPRLPQKTLLP